MSKKNIGYSIALLTSLAYAVWYMGSAYVASAVPNAYSILVPLLMIQLTSFIVLFALSKGKMRVKSRKALTYAVLSGVVFGVAGIVFYTLLRGGGVVIGSAFGSADVLVFSALMLFHAKIKISAPKYLFGAVLVSLGLALETIKLSGGKIVFDPYMIGLGILLSLLWGIAYFFLFLANRYKEEQKTSLILWVLITVALVYLCFILLLHGNITFQIGSIEFLGLVIVLGLTLLLSFFLDITQIRDLIPVGRSAVSVGYALSDLSLLPILVYALFLYPKSWPSYVPGLVLITIGIILMDTS